MKQDVFLNNNLLLWRKSEPLSLSETLLAECEKIIFAFGEADTKKLTTEEIVNSVLSALNLKSNNLLVNLQMAKTTLPFIKSSKVNVMARLTIENKKKIDVVAEKMGVDMNEAISLVLVAFIAINRDKKVFV